MTLPWLPLENWRTRLRDLDEANRVLWPRTATARLSEMDWYTLLTEMITPLHNFHPMNFEGQDTGQDREPLTVNETYRILAICAQLTGRWLTEDLAPRLRAANLPPTEMSFKPGEDIQAWAKYRSEPMPPEPRNAGEGLHWMERKWMARKLANSLPAQDAPLKEWHTELTKSVASVHETLHRLALLRIYIHRDTSPDLPPVDLMINNLYQTVVWLSASLQEWAINLERHHGAHSEEPTSHDHHQMSAKGREILLARLAAVDNQPGDVPG